MGCCRLLALPLAYPTVRYLTALSAAASHTGLCHAALLGGRHTLCLRELPGMSKPTPVCQPRR